MLETIGFIGLGEMGKPMAKNLVKKGYTVIVCGHRNKAPVNELAELGAVIANSPREMARQSHIIMSVVKNATQTDELLYGTGFWEGQGVLAESKPGMVLLLASTLEPEYCQKLAEKLKEKGMGLLDCPVSGGVPASESGSLAIMIGGDRAIFEKCLPVFQAVGKHIFFLGGVGMGQVCKLVNNYMMVIQAYGISEALSIGLEAGLALESMVAVCKVGSGANSIVNRWELMLDRKRQYNKDKTGAISLYSRDLTLGLGLASELGVKAPLGSFVLGMDPTRLFPTEPGM